MSCRPQASNPKIPNRIFHRPQLGQVKYMISDAQAEPPSGGQQQCVRLLSDKGQRRDGLHRQGVDQPKGDCFANI